MKTILKTVFIFLFLSLSLLAYNYVPKNDNTIINFIASEINRALPQKIDSLVTLDSVKGVDNRLEFNGTFSELEYDKQALSSKQLKDFTFEELDSFKKEFILKTQENQLLLFCLNKSTRAILDSGVAFRYSYNFESTKEYIGTVNVTSYECKNSRGLKALK